jgi:hypothetical protein
MTEVRQFFKTIVFPIGRIVMGFFMLGGSVSCMFSGKLDFALLYSGVAFLMFTD